MKVFLYARVSTDEQKTNDDQINELRDYCTLYKHEVEGIYKDKESGLTTERKDFQRMLRDIREDSNNVKAVVVWRFDRLSRSLMDLNNIANFLKEQGLELISMHEHVDTSKPEGKLLFNLLGSIAEFEIDTIKVRTELGMKRAKREGKLCHRPRKEINIQKVRRTIESGCTLEEVAKMQGMSYVTLKKRIDEAGIEIVRGCKIK